MVSFLVIFRMTPPATRSLPKHFKFERTKSPPVVVNFKGGQVTSDAGLSLRVFQEINDPEIRHLNQFRVGFFSFLATGLIFRFR
ncbi:transposase [Nostoc sp. CHAB 5784]|uniref:transposase n=1 Tax=Nostoc mirabile TaxID=2907820 RepID=UPI001E3A0691|nr:transposase [Nostoc mirabile]MCC5668884.1 transposase [Nostoc mirabile CHAB5784]